jgi:hypothetical protein
MINVTDKIIVINKKGLNKEISKSIDFQKKEMLGYHCVTEEPIKINKENRKYGFLFNIKENNKITTGFLSDIELFINNQNSSNIAFKRDVCKKDDLLEVPYLRVFFKFILLDLWKKGFILLPISFSLNVTGYSEGFVSKYNNDLIKKVKNNFEKKDTSNFSKDFRLNYVSKISRIIRATNYNNFKDISMEEINNLHIEILKSKRGLTKSKFPKSAFYIETFLLEVKKENKDFEFDNMKYKSWLLGFFTRHKEFNYLEYLKEEDNLKEYRRAYNTKQTQERKNKNKVIEKPLNIVEEEFFRINKGNHSWCIQIPHYDGYSFDENEKDSETWRFVFNAYLDHRSKNGYEDTTTSKIVFNFLMNYIFFYLKIWNSKNNKDLSVPLAPKDFHRTLYVNNKSLSSQTEKRPFTLTELLELRYESESSRNSYIRNIELFFNFISDFFEEEKEVWNSNLSNPIRKSDYYREYKNKKTNKVIIPKSIYGKLKKYLYAVESFGEYLQEKILNEDNVDSINLEKQKSFKTEDLGYVPIFFDKDVCYPILNINNSFLFKNRELDIGKLLNEKSSRITKKKISSNTIIRAMILMLNTGLRAAQVSWLDRNTWDINKENEFKAYYRLNVNTDKTKNSEWSTYVSSDVYNSLKKETFFQESMQEDFANIPINYQGREYSRFEDIICLFKSDSKKGLPVAFTEYWADVLWDFQNVINEIEKNNIKLITISKNKNHETKISSEGNKYSPLNIKAVHTPHSMRATFCTHMSEYLERSEIAALVGHASDLITSEVYIKPEDSVVMDKISKAVDILDNGGVNSDYFDKESNVHTKPNLKNSSLQKAFSENRDQTIELFNITSISLNINKETELQSQKAISLLKDARMDQVIFETTHICPVGGICPQEVMGAIGEKRRCGLCPLALKCIDNINPIYAKQRDLICEIKDGKDKLELSIKNNESDITLNNIEDKVNLDIRELVSWKFSADILSEHYEQLKVNPDLDKKYYVEMPDMVKKHLTKVSVSNEKEYLLTRIADSNAYSAYSNANNKYQAEMIKRNLIKNLGLFEYEDINVPEEDKIEVFCAMMKNMMDTNGVDLKELVSYDCFKSIEDKKEQKKLLFKNIKLLK